MMDSKMIDDGVAKEESGISQGAESLSVNEKDDGQVEREESGSREGNGKEEAGHNGDGEYSESPIPDGGLWACLQVLSGFMLYLNSW